ncbi:hypothetical protein CDAR_479461 [Caerostris darwini]|uniref:BTB domain-containing protein n=1 Tax=Caerostris darwini TaxID=1538125 RepID=A0AAV4MS08_9ARAC|nr:hypothetical protein CDAR_479461 [Caerostris darwini]
MSATTELSESRFNFSWQIEEFEHRIRKHYKYITSPTFRQICVHSFLACVVLDAKYDGDRCDLKFSVKSVKDEEVGSVRKFTFKIFIVDEKQVHHCVQRHLSLSIQSETIRISLSKREEALSAYLWRGCLRLKFHIYICIDPAQTARFNFHSNLKNLSNDMERLRHNESLKELVLAVEGSVFNVHKCVLWARWPDFQKYFESYKKLVVFNTKYQCWVMQLRRLIHAAIKISRSHLQLSAEEHRMKVTEIACLLTSELADCLLHYVYCGLLKGVPACKQSDLVRLSRFFGLGGIVQKHQRTSIASTGTTRCYAEHHYIHWSRGDSRRWQQNNFPAVRQLVRFRNRKNGLLQTSIAVRHATHICVYLRFSDFIGSEIEAECSILIEEFSECIDSVRRKVSRRRDVPTAPRSERVRVVREELHHLRDRRRKERREDSPRRIRSVAHSNRSRSVSPNLQRRLPETLPTRQLPGREPDCRE